MRWAPSACWAMYIVFGRRAGLQSGGQTTAMGMLIGAICIAPFGVAHAGALLLKPEILPTALGVAFLSSALPYSLEMYSMTRLPARVFRVLMSLDPALAAASGLVLLGERLSWLQWAAIACIVARLCPAALPHPSGRGDRDVPRRGDGPWQQFRCWLPRPRRMRLTTAGTPQPRTITGPNS